MKQRDIAVDFIKFFAVFLIINSHLDIAYPRFGALATGGAIGDALFLFVSGYTLFLGALKPFGAYMAGRVKRIYPSVAAALLFIFLLTPGWRPGWLDFLGGEFIVAIMVYYVLLYGVRRYALNHIRAVFVALGVVTLAVYVFFFPYKSETGDRGLFGITTQFRWIPFFGYMLLGAWMGLLRKEGKLRARRPAWTYLALTLVCVALFYAPQQLAKMRPEWGALQIVSVLPLAGVMVWFYKWCDSAVFHRLYAVPWVNTAVMCVGGLCLESYLIQFALITDKLNGIFPVNLPVLALLILVAAYAVRCVARLIGRLIDRKKPDWAAIFALK